MIQIEHIDDSEHVVNERLRKLQEAGHTIKDIKVTPYLSDSHTYFNVTIVYELRKEAL